MKKVILFLILIGFVFTISGCKENTKEDDRFLSAFVNADYTKGYQEEFDVYFVSEDKENFIIEIIGEIYLDGNTVEISTKLSFTQEDTNYWNSEFLGHVITIYRSTTTGMVGIINFFLIDGYEYLIYTK